jgi:hypothetical protein
MPQERKPSGQIRKEKLEGGSKSNGSRWSGWSGGRGRIELGVVLDVEAMERGN